LHESFTIEGRGTVVTGRVVRGSLPKGCSVEIVGLSQETPRLVVVTGVQSFHRDRPEAKAGENVGLLLRGVGRDEIVRGQALVAPGSVDPHLQGEAELFVLTAKEGGRHTPFGVGYKPQFFFGATDVTGEIETIVGAASVEPGGHARVSFKLVRRVPLEAGMRFAIREGGKTVGAGAVLSVG
jgi:elongation factor Tu